MHGWNMQLDELKPCRNLAIAQRREYDKCSYRSEEHTILWS